MDLPNLFSANSDKENQVMVIFVHLTDVKAQSFLLEISRDGTKVLERSYVFDYKGASDCLIKIDESLQQLGKKSEPIDSVIFGLNHSWVKKGEIVKEKNPLLKKITDELSLKALGFIVISEAIVQQKISGNSLFSGIIATLSKKDLTLSLVHQGKIKSVESVGRSSDGKGDFLEGLARFSSKSEKEGFYLPTRIILVSMDLDEAELRKHQQIIYDSDWNKQSQFLQPPTVEVMLKKEYEEMITKEAAKAVALQKGMTQAALAATVVAKKDGHDAKPVAGATELDSEELGFSDLKTDKDKETALDKNLAPTSFGVPISTKEFDKELISNQDKNLKEPDFEDDSELAVELSDKKNKKVNSKKSDDEQEFKPDRNKPGKKKKHYKNFKLYILVGFITGLIALIAIAFFGITYAATAELTVDLKTRPVSKDLEITLDANIKETDVEKLILQAGKVLKSKESQSMMQTTGVTIVGEKSKGKVTVYNSTNAEKKFDKGTRLSLGELTFELDDDVTIASESSIRRGETIDGKADVNVTAMQIGADSNLTEDTELVVEPFDKSSYYAYVADEDFVGGASREVKVVSEDDRLELLVDLRKEIVEEINKEFEEEAVDGVYVLPSNNIVSEKPVFNYEIGNEAEELSLTLEIELEAITYSAKDLKPIATKVLASEIPDNHRLADKDPQILSQPTESNLDLADSEKPIALSANISSYAIPEISEDSIKNDIKGKKIDEAKSLLESRDEIDSVEVSLSPSFAASFIRKIPGKLEKIMIKLISE